MSLQCLDKWQLFLSWTMFRSLHYWITLHVGNFPFSSSLQSDHKSKMKGEFLMLKVWESKGSFYCMVCICDSWLSVSSILSTHELIVITVKELIHVCPRPGSTTWNYTEGFRDCRHCTLLSLMPQDRTGLFHCLRATAYFLNIELPTYIMSSWAFYLQNMGAGGML
jgi:hypothetical protein